MFLKRLEVIGFKSFADHTSVEFVPGITAVVGPNGSGKSNIADSIRWVLGEQSAKSLRGSKMEDIIFAGSDGRKPLNFAEVTLILDNSDEHLEIDYSEVSVKRRVYRSGESEYYINQQPCRLKDIVDLFLDSGLGKEAYSIIGQGKVDEILTSKPEERRVIFEEAAGVLKYKTRKVTAEKRLVETEENLNRVEDILYELQDQLEPLQIQASIAKEYLEKREELKEVDIALQVYEITELHRRWTEEKAKLTDVKQKVDQYEATLKEMERERLELREKSSELSANYESAQLELLETSEAFEKNSGQRRLLEERMKNAVQHKEQLEKRIAEKTRRYEQLKNEWQQEQKKYEDGKKRVEQLEEIVRRKKAMVAGNDKELDEVIEQRKADYIEVLNERASLRNERRYMEEQARQLDVREKRLVDENEGVISEHEKLKQRLEVEKEETEKLESVLEKEAALFRKRKEELEQKKAHYHKKETALYETYQLTQRLKSRADVLEEMQADFSGFYQGVRAVLKARHELKGVVGAVAELIQVPKQYETALEIALGGASQHIVVNTEEDARNAVSFLKKRQGGRATFLPISVIKSRHIPPETLRLIETHPAFVGIASTLLSTDKRYVSIMYHLLGNVIVARDLEGANHIARLSGYRYRIVTLDGDVVNPGGSITGGMVKETRTPLLGRKRELETLKQKLKELNELTEKLEREVKQLKGTIQHEQVELERYEENVENIRESVQERRAETKSLERDVEVLQADYSRFLREKEVFRQERSFLEERLKQIDRETEAAEEKAKKLEEEIQRLEEEREENMFSREKIQEELVNDQINLARAKERYVSLKSEVNRLYEEKTIVDEELTQLKEEYEWLLTEMNEEESGAGKLEEQIEWGKRRKEELTESITKMKDELQTIERAYEQLELSIKTQQQTYAHLAKECQEIEVKVNRMDVELDNRLTHLAEEYEISYEAAKDRYPLQLSVEEARTKVELIKLSIEELGTVNLGAIDEYERILERHQFLTDQRTDLVEAKETLHQVIAQLDEEMTTRFYYTFSQVREQFQETFRLLFGGGEADLILTDPEQLLTTGVDIIARPPGKKMQHLGLLSGGEKALTAIALLFAILRVRPVPFCVLDEVEAALDEANVGRFAHFLRDFSANTQFIVITHRKGTMEEADVLYGVTMEESGVSKLVSVKLEETESMMIES